MQTTATVTTTHGAKTPELLEQETTVLPATAQSLSITDAPSFERAGSFLRTVKALRAEVESVFGPIVSSAHATWKHSIAQRKRVEDPMIEAESIVKRSIAAYHAEQERVMREEQRRREEEARRQEEERRLAEAIEIEALGDAEEAERVLSEPSFAPPPPPLMPQRVAGISTREAWSARVVNLRELVRAVSDGKAPIEALKADMTTLNQMARALKGSLSIPGVEPTCETSVSARAIA